MDGKKLVELLNKSRSKPYQDFLKTFNTRINNSGISDIIFYDEWKSIPSLATNNGLSWTRKSGILAKQFIINKYKNGSRITKIKLTGFNNSETYLKKINT